MLTANQKLLLKSLEQHLGIISKAAAACGMTRQSHYDWLKTSEEYRNAWKIIDEDCKDIIEDAIIQKILDGDTTMIIFAAKCRLKDRGYVERQEQVLKTETTNPINVLINVTKDVRDKDKG